MVPPAVVEQQAKLGVSAEESKAQRLKRQQARFRDRGGAFVPTESNPLVDILLARTVSGESPSKTRPKRLSPSKARHASPAHNAGAVTVTKENQAIAGSSKAKLPASRKRKARAVETEVDTATKPAPKRRGRPVKAKKAPDSDVEQPPPNTKSKSSKEKGERHNIAPSTSEGKPKRKQKAKPKSNSTREVVEVLVSDDQTLVDAPHKAKSNPKKNLRYEDDDETDDDAPVVGKQAKPHVDDSKPSRPKTTTRAKTEKTANTGSSRKKTLQDGEGRTQDERHPKAAAKLPQRLHGDDDDDDDDDDIAGPPPKKGKTVNSTSAKSKNAIDPEDVKNEAKSKATGKGKGNLKARAGPEQDVAKLVEDDDEQRVSEPKKRKKEEDDHDDRARKVVKFSEPGLPHSSSRKLKENQSDRKYKSAIKSSVEDEPDAPPVKLATKPPSRAKTPKGPPREVLERIKASAVQYLRCADSEPDELDCLS